MLTSIKRALELAPKAVLPPFLIEETMNTNKKGEYAVGRFDRRYILGLVKSLL